MNLYRYGCSSAGVDTPGNNVLIGLMGELKTPAGTRPDSLLLVKTQMIAGGCSAPAQSDCEFLVHIITGSVLSKVDGEEARLITGDTLRIPSRTTYQFSTVGTRGLTALWIMPQQENSFTPSSSVLPACCVDAGMTVKGVPQQMAVNSLDILRTLTPLTSDGCTLPLVQMTRGNMHRNAIFATLLPQYAADPIALRAFILQCNAQRAPWWHNQDHAQRSIVKGTAQLLALKRKAD